MPLAITDAGPPPEDMPLLGSIRVGSGGVAHAAERLSAYSEDALRWSRFLKYLP